MGPQLARDTAWDVERRQIEGWRQMSPAQKAAIVTGLTTAAFELTRAGIRQRYPNASSREQYLRMAIVTLGWTLARRAYPDIDSFNQR